RERDMYVKYGNQTSTIKSTVAASNSYSVSFTLAKNTTMPIEIYANIGTAANITATHSARATSTITGTTTGSSTSVTTGAIVGQTIAYGAGSIASATSASSAIPANLYSNQNADVASFDFTTTNDAFTISEVTVTFAALPTTLTQVHLKDGGTVLQSKPAAASVTFTGLSIPVAANTTKTLTGAVTVGNVGTGAGATGEAVTMSLFSYKNIDSQGTEATDANVRAGNAQYAFKAIPQIDNDSLPTGSLNDGTMTLAKVKVQGMGGTIGWKKVQFSITKTLANVTITSPEVYDVTAGQTVAGVGSLVSTGATTTNCLAAEDSVCTAVFVATAEQQVSGTRVYELRAVVAGSVAGTSVSTNLTRPTAHATSAAYSTVALTGATFVWTDRALNGHSESTLDWTNEFGLKNLPSSVQALTR
ncbi:MAG: hypothetical protein KW804_01090, partial [Candidatus Doudnabacteria bacterium]|nr:hypothetical protein [Candidatus Doudnabacteria bacterium]